MSQHTSPEHPDALQQNDYRDNNGIYDLLKLLGNADDDVVSISVRSPGSQRLSVETRTVKSLRHWDPPADADVYFSINPLRELLPPGRRGGIADVAKSRALYADLDVKDGALASIEECEQVVKLLAARLGTDPCAVIYSGHGLQPVWRIADPPDITDAAVEAKTMSASWSVFVRDVVRRVNPSAAVDSVFNLDRILRCPGTTNWKDPDAPVAVDCFLHTEASGLSLEHLRETLPAAEAAISPAIAFGTEEQGQAVLDSFRSGAITEKTTAKINDLVAAIETGTDRHAAMNEALMGLVGLGARGESGVVAAIRCVEALYAPVQDEHGDPEEFDRSLDGALRKIAGDPQYRPLDFESRGLEPGGPWGPGSGWVPVGDGTHTRGPVTRSPQTDRERFAAVSASELAGAIPPMRWLIKGVWADHSFGPLAGEKKTLKSYNLLSMSVAVASGESLFGEFEVPTPGAVLYFAGEGGRYEHQRRLQAIAAAYGVPLEDLPLHTVFDTAGLDDPAFVDALYRHLDSLQPRLVVIDPLYAFHPAEVEAQNLYARGRMLAKFQGEVGDQTSLIIADHFNKTGRGDLDLDSIAQSGMGQWADSWMLQRHREHPDHNAGTFQLGVQMGSRRWGVRDWDIDWSLPPVDAIERGEVGQVSWSVQRASATPSAKTSPRRENDLLRLVDANQFVFTRSQLAKSAGGNKANTERLIQQLIDRRELVIEERKALEGSREVARDRVGRGPGPSFGVTPGAIR